MAEHYTLCSYALNDECKIAHADNAVGKVLGMPCLLSQLRVELLMVTALLEKACQVIWPPE